MSVSIIQDQMAWANKLKEVTNTSGACDIFFEYHYVNLYVKLGDIAELFVFESDGECFLIPWIVSPIETGLSSKPLFDFTTAYGYGGPLSTTNNSVFLNSAWIALIDHCRKRDIICGFIRFHPLLENHRWASHNSVTVVDDRQTVVLGLAQESTSALAGYTAEARRKIRKSERSGVTVECRTDMDSLEIFSHLYQEHMRELSAREDYFFGDDYFRGVSSLGRGRWRVYLAERDGQVLGGALILLSDRWAHFHLSSCLNTYVQFNPNNLLRHAVIMDLLGKQWEMLHFGGGLTADPEDSLLRFKSGYSRERATFRFGQMIICQLTYDAICSEWTTTHPDKIEQFGNYFLKYRYV